MVLEKKTQIESVRLPIINKKSRSENYGIFLHKNVICSRGVFSVICVYDKSGLCIAKYSWCGIYKIL